MRSFIELSKTRLLSYGLFILSGVILGLSLYFTSTVRVIKDWSLDIPSGQIHAGDQLVLISKYTKLRNVDGTALRYIECKTKAGVFVRYPINEAIANRQAGRGGTGIPIVIPRDIPDLPTTCKFSISITYPVLPFKPDYEKNSTREFVLLPAQQPPAPASVTPK